MIILCATMDPPPLAERWGRCTSPAFFDADDSRSVVEKYDQLWHCSNTTDLVFYVHDDVVIHEPDWEHRIESEFSDPQVAIVGFGGALGLGTPDLYKRPYRIEQLARQDYYSNQRDWEVHGKRETGARDVAVVDGFAMAIRLEWLGSIGGWSWMIPHVRFHCYDVAMCLRAIRDGKKVRMVGIDCTHAGGGTSTKEVYAEWCRSHNTTMEREHSEPHRWLFSEFRDILPVRI